MKKNNLIIFFFIISLTTFAQDVDLIWAKVIGGPSGEVPYSMVLDEHNNIYITGNFSGTADFDPGPGTYSLTSAGDQDIFICKLDASGVFKWARRIGSVGPEWSASIAVDDMGNVYTTGSYSFTVDFDPGAGIYNLTTNGYDDIYINKLNSLGNFVWAKSIGEDFGDYGCSLAVNAAGDVYATGVFNHDTLDIDPGPGVYYLTGGGTYIIKLNSSGNFVWATSFENSNPRAITLDAAGNVYTTGTVNPTAVDFDPGPGVYYLNGGGAFISKLNANGGFIWARNFGGAGAISIAVDANGNVYTTGSMGSGDFDPGLDEYNLTSQGLGDVFVSKLNSSGNFEWAKNFGGVENDEGRSIIVDADGFVYITGAFQYTVDFDPGPGEYNLIGGYGAEPSFFISKFDPSGDFVWAKDIKNSYGAYSAVDSIGNIFTTATFRGTTDVNPNAGVYSLTSDAASGDFFVLKFCQIPSSPKTIFGSAGMCPGTTGVYSIAPVSHATSYTWTLPAGWTGTSTSDTIFVSAGTSDGDITVFATNACGSSILKSRHILASLVITATSDTICVGQTAFLSANGADTYTWSGGITSTTDTASIAPAITTTYTVTGSLSTCIDSAFAVVTVNPLPPTPTIISGWSGWQTLTSSASTGNQWYRDGVLIPGETYQTLSSFPNGSYTVIVTLLGCNSNPSDPVIIVDAGIYEIANPYAFSINPNPSNGNFYVTFDATIKSNYRLELYNTLGQIIFKNDLVDFSGVFRKDFSIAQYGRGVYTLSLTNFKNKIDRKIIVY